MMWSTVLSFVVFASCIVAQTTTTLYPKGQGSYSGSYFEVYNYNSPLSHYWSINQTTHQAALVPLSVWQANQAAYDIYW